MMKKIIFSSVLFVSFLFVQPQNENSILKKENNMVSELISKNPNAKVIVMFGGNPHKRKEVIQELSSIGDITIYGTLSEEEGYAKIKSLQKIDLVLIGGRYEQAQRLRIRQFMKEHLPQVPLTEPGIDYAYDNEVIWQKVKSFLAL
jgi:hypothetical protein